MCPGSWTQLHHQCSLYHSLYACQTTSATPSSGFLYHHQLSFYIPKIRLMFVLDTIFLSSSGFIDKNDDGLSLKTPFRYRKILANPQNSLLAEMTFSSSKQSGDPRLPALECRSRGLLPCFSVGDPLQYHQYYFPEFSRFYSNGGEIACNAK